MNIEVDMPSLVRNGRSAIEHAILKGVMLPHVPSEEEQAELSELFSLLVKYNQLMRKYEPTSNTADAANDSKGALA